ncbi:MAG TPA: nicotinate-nucleotide--dimethylbenzimidazole phosphoribosyltransferase [Acidimicrobiia bacterium]|nr:nicotinate-nucleotide--dimethylbenzimidazole phosphoribosyltransferase [Acidimicrobiia bacterium]
MSTDLFGVATMAVPDEDAASLVAERAGRVLRPPGALRFLDDLAVWLASWQRTGRPAVERPAVLIFGGDHGVTVDGVSAYPASVTASMMEALRSGTATAAVMARHLGARLEVVDVGVGRPTGNIRTEPALSEEQLEQAIDVGRAAVTTSGDIDLLVVGEIGIGNTTPAAAMCLALFGGEVGDWVGAGTGLDPDGVAKKARVVSEAVDRVSVASPLEILRELGGWELAAIAGAVVEARQRSIPVLLDGFVVTSAVMPLEVAHIGYLDHCWPAHVSAEPGHRRLVDKLGRRPILDLEMRLGEASGALAALPIVALAARSVVDVATFEEWGLT